MLDAFDHEDGEWFADSVRAPARARERRPRLRCAGCRTLIETAAEAIEIAGAQRHDCVNPGGFQFRVHLFAATSGLRLSGAPEAAHSWFPPYAWQPGHCGACGAHVGWRFSCGDDAFSALIEARFIDEATR